MPRLDVSAAPEPIGGGCTRITLPDPFVPHVTSVFLLERGHSAWLLDAGADTPESVEALDSDLSSLDLSTVEVEGVVLSHTHLDHAGGLRRWTPRRVIAHEDAAAEMRNLSPRSSRGPEALRRMGVPEEDIAILAPDGEPVAAGNPLARIVVHRELRGPSGDFSEGPPGWSWQLAGGHAPGHLLLFNEASGLLLAGDQFMVKWKTPYLISDPDQDSFGAYLLSIEQVARLAPSAICSSHTVTIDEPGPWLSERREVLLHQVDRALEAVAGGAATAWETMFAVYPRVRPGGLRIVLLREHLAILRHLASSGGLRREVVQGVERYESA